MFNKQERLKNEALDHEIKELVESMNEVQGNDEEYTKMAQNVEVLSKARSYGNASQLNVNTVLAVAGNLLGIGIICGFEKIHIISSKALGFVGRAH